MKGEQFTTYVIKSGDLYLKKVGRTSYWVDKLEDATKMTLHQVVGNKNIYGGTIHCLLMEVIDWKTK